MIESLTTHLRCPSEQASLDLWVDHRDGEDIIEGLLKPSPGNDAAVSPENNYPIKNGVPSFVKQDELQSQTIQSFAQKWAQHDYYREHTKKFYFEWYLQRYGFGSPEGLGEFLCDKQFVLDAGTGSGRDAEVFASLGSGLVYGVDTAREALEIARRDVHHSRLAFIHADLHKLPFADGFFDFINCDQVIHHTPDPQAAFRALSKKLRTGGQICCYVYKKKAVIREFTDDYIRERISHLPVDEALKICESITALGQVLAQLKATVNIKQDIPALGIKQGEYDLQRFFHWNVMKCFWNEDFDFFTNNIINVDWYHPEYCFRFTPQEFRAWFPDHQWEIQAWDVQDAGISCRARKLK